jgi:uncharacterized protein YciI
MMSRDLPPNRPSRRLLVHCLLAMTLGAAVAVPTALQLASATAEPDSSTKGTWLVIYRPGPAWAPGKPITEQPPKEHGKYLLDLFSKGKMKFAGPFMDNAGGAVVLEVASEAEAISLVKGDPAVQQNVFLYEVHPWRLVDWQKRVKK